MNLLKYTGTGLFIVLFSLLCLPLSGSEIPEQIPKTALICEKAYNNAGSEVRATFDYLKSLSPQAGYLTFKDIRHHPRLLSGYSVLWFQRNDTTVFSEMETNRKIIHSLRDFIQNGGSLLLTGEAFRYILPLGLENISPQDSLKRSMDEGYGRKLGFHAWKDHPIFSGMNGGSYILMPFKDTTVRITGYFGKFLPENGKVVAVDWDYIFMRETSKIVVEYGLGKGKVLAVGGYMAFSSLNMNRKHLDFFTQNVLKYLAGETLSSFPNYWDYSESQIKKAFPPSSVFPPFIIPESKTWIIPDNPMTLKAKYASGNSWDVASERLLTMGTEYGGIKEVWAHPFMAFRDYEAGIRFSYSDTIYWFTDEHPEIQVMPDGLVREYKFSRGYLKEVIVNDPSEPAGVIHYEYQGVYPAELILRFNSNLRIMWPYSENVNRLIRHSWLDSIQAFFAGDKSGELCLLFGANKKPDMKLEGQFEGFIPIKGKKEFEGIPTSAFKASFLLCYPLGMNDRMDVVYAASGEGFDKTFYSYKKAISDPYAIFSRAKEHISSLFHNNLQITTPDSGFNLGYQWAMLGTDRFMVNTPGMGRSVVAGYATTENGWDGEQKVSGRPGYSWYFGRDGEWSGFAILDYGDFEKVKDILAFYKKYQDLSGKIFHEATTSGVIHYDAADATPLYIVLAGKYFRHTNDLEYLKSNWGSIRKAIDFCFSTDTDNDHLIENTNVGHGWIEGGKLYGSHATLYLNGIWASALDEAANMAKALGYAEADNYQQESKIVKQIINNDFWIDRIKFFSYGKNKDNSFRLEPTVLPAVPLYFHLAEEEKAGLILDRYAGNHFTTNWGIRVVGDESPLFNPTGYHYGSVWPLFTGWTSLAEYAYGRNDVAFSHLMENLSIYRYWGLGFIEEVLNGSRYVPSGVCFHQCWSETMVLQPAIEGLLGLRIDLPKNMIYLSPHLPANWDSIGVSNIHIGIQRMDFHMLRDKEKYSYRFSFTGNYIPVLKFMPSFPAGTVIRQVNSDGKKIPFTTFKTSNALILLVDIDLEKYRTIDIYYEKGISTLPVIQTPQPGSSSEGLRVIHSSLKGNLYTIEVEGPSGTQNSVDVYSNGNTISSVIGGKPEKISGNLFRIYMDFEPQSLLKYIRKDIVIEMK